MKRIHAFVSGRVQGVNFRWSTKSFAERFGITGFAKNLSDGRVEVVAEGDEKSIDSLIDFLGKGSIFSRVERVEVKEEKFKGEFSEFFIF
ncbi:MAG: acylphosphatase [Candidatus Heimdallarchaeota archaeon]